jgi:hypothetical protein
MAFNDPITDEQIDTFIDVLTKSGNVSFACRLAGISHSHSYYMKKNKAGFSDRWEEALKVAADSLEEEARRRAVDGVDKPVFYQGACVGTMKEYSDQLLIQLLKAHKPDQFNERLQVSGPGGGQLIVDHVITLKRRTPEMEGLVIDGQTKKPTDQAGRLENHNQPTSADAQPTPGGEPGIKVGIDVAERIPAEGEEEPHRHSTKDR